MGFKIEIDEKGVKKKLEDIERNAKKLEGTKTVPFDEIFNTPFMSKYTQYSTFDEMLDDSGLLKKYGDFESIDDNEWDLFIQQNTSFNNWEAMKGEAGKIYYLNQLGL
jgi:hypothetical protein